MEVASHGQKIISRTSPIWLDLMPENPPAHILAEIVGWLNNKEVVKYSEQRHKEHNKFSQAAYIHTFKGKDRYWGIYLANDLIGTISYRIDEDNGIANVGILIGTKEHHGKGYGFEAWRRICDYLFKVWNIRKIEAGCMAANHAMIGICQKYGMVEEGRQEKHFLLDDGLTTDLIHWGKFND